MAWSFDTEADLIGILAASDSDRPTVGGNRHGGGYAGFALDRVVGTPRIAEFQEQRNAALGPGIPQFGPADVTDGIGLAEEGEVSGLLAHYEPGRSIGGESSGISVRQPKSERLLGTR